jgi:enoyl-CoA hydratase/carnithine racemase
MPVTREIDGHIMTITIDGYNHLNPMTQDMYLEMFGHFEELEKDSNLRVGILRGAGDEHFSAGGNLKVYGNANEVLPENSRLQAWFTPYSAHPSALSMPRVTIWGNRGVKPMISAIKGYCLGAAVMLVGFRSSIRIAGESSKIGLAEILRGLGGSAGVRSYIPKHLSYANASWLGISGRSVDAQEALRIGLVTEVVPDDQVFTRAREVAEIVAANAPVALLASRWVMNQAEGQPQERAAAFAASMGTLASLDPDLREGYEAFVEKRQPNFKGLAN